MSPVLNNKSKGLSGNIFRLLPYVLAILLWAILALRGQIFLKKVEDLSLFLFDWLYFKESIKIPGGFLGVAGSFLSQFLYLPWLGSLIWVFLLLITYQLTIRILRIPEQYMALAIIPATLLVIGNMSLGYGVFIMREQDHFFAPLLGYLAALIPISAINRIKPVWGKILLLVIWTSIGFPLFGSFALLGTLSAACTAFTATDMLRKNRIGLFSTGIALIILVPVIAYNFYTTYRLADSWFLGLPTISEDVWTHAVRAPFQLAMLFIPVMLIASRWFKENGKTLILKTAVFVISVTAVWGLWFKDENFNTELAMSQAVDNSDWKKVIDIYQKAAGSHTESDAKAYSERSKALSGIKDQNTINEILDKYDNRFFEPTRTMVLYRDLALLKMNRALDESFTMKDGGRMQKSRTQVPMALQSGKQLYLQYGLVNMSYRWCLEDVIEHNWSFSTLKYMVMHSVIMHESEFARKYLNKLKKTIFYRRWAIEQSELAVDSVLMANSEPYKSILPYMCFENRMTNDLVKSETFLMRHFSEPEPPHATPEYDRAALLWAMRLQNIPAFWQHLYSYLQSNNVKELPRSVQEAALLYSNLEKRNTELPFSKAVNDSYNAFNQYVKANPVRNLKESAYPFSQKYGKTFYYYYYFIRNIQTY